MVKVDRIRRLIVSPTLAWQEISAEKGTIAGLYVNWIMPLAAIGSVANFISKALTEHESLMKATIADAVTWVAELIGTFIMAMIASAFAPLFGGKKGIVPALKLVTFSYSIAWVAAVFDAFGSVGRSIAWVLGFYSLYVLYKGGQPILGIVGKKQLGYASALAMLTLLVTSVSLIVFGKVIIVITNLTGWFVPGP